MNANRRKLSLSWTLTGVFIIVSAIVIFLGIQFINKQKENLIGDKKVELKTITDLKVGQIAQWRHERMGDAIIIQDNISLIDQIRDFLKKADNTIEKITLLRWMNSIIKNYDYFSAAIADSKGQVKLSVPAGDSTIGPFLKSLVQNALADKKIMLTDLHKVPPDNFIGAMAVRGFEGITEGTEYSTEFRIIRPDRSVKYIKAFGKVVRGEKGSASRVIGINYDITSQKKSEIELEKSLSLLKATIESTADGLLVVDANGKIVQYNRKFAEMWKIPQEILDKQDDNLAISFVQDQLKDPGTFVSNVQYLYFSPEMITNDILEFKDGRVFERYSQPQKINDLTVGRVWSFSG